MRLRHEASKEWSISNPTTSMRQAVKTPPYEKGGAVPIAIMSISSLLTRRNCALADVYVCLLEGKMVGATGIEPVTPAV